MDGLLGPLFARWIGYDIPGLGLLDDGRRRAGDRRRRHQRARQAPPAARRVLPPEGAAVPHDVRAGEAVDRRLLARQRDGLQARGARARIRGAGTCWDSSRASSRWIPVRVAKRWWPSTCRPTTCTSGDVAVFPREAVSFPDLTVEQGIRIFLTGGMALGGRMELRAARNRCRRRPAAERPCAQLEHAYRALTALSAAWVRFGAFRRPQSSKGRSHMSRISWEGTGEHGRSRCGCWRWLAVAWLLTRPGHAGVRGTA